MEKLNHVMIDLYLLTYSKCNFSTHLDSRNGLGFSKGNSSEPNEWIQSEIQKKWSFMPISNMQTSQMAVPCVF